MEYLDQDLSSSNEWEEVDDEWEEVDDESKKDNI